MSRRSGARHARPGRRGPFAATETPLESDVAALRAASFSDYLELVRLSALVDGVFEHVERLSRDVIAVRHELDAVRSAPAPRDPRIDLLAREVVDLRATVSSNNALLTDLTRHVLELLSQLAMQGSALVGPTPTPTPTASPAGQREPTSGAAPARVQWSGRPRPSSREVDDGGDFQPFDLAEISVQSAT